MSTTSDKQQTAQQTALEGLLPVGTVVDHGKYRIVRHLGSGGFGNTYEAVNTAFNEQVAIKELFIKDKCGRAAGSSEVSITLTENRRTFEQHQKKFRKEAQRLHKLQNPHIVRVHDFFDDNGTSYYVMDYVEGENLSEHLKRTNKPFSEREVMEQMLPQLLEALDEVHAQGIWHLDIKPGNIMMDRQGNLVLIDFGASKQMHTSDGQSQSTSTTMACTPGYAPTEQMDGNLEKFGPWTDLYSLGATLYHLLTLRQPPLSSSISEDPDGALKFPKSVSKSTVELVKWLMKPVRTMRPQSVEAVRQFLKEASEQPHEQKPEPKPKPNDKDDTKLIEKHSQLAPDPTPGINWGVWRLRAGIGLLSIGLLAGVMVGIRHCQTDGGGEVDTTHIVPVGPALKQVENLRVTVNEGPKNMREYQFTGQIIDTIGALPNGQGKAEFPPADGVPASTYVGRFEQGLCHDSTGKAKLTFTNGDKYVGTFVHGCYATGRYTMGDGAYFSGTFQDGRPYNGKWFNADGTFSANVRQGREL